MPALSKHARHFEHFDTSPRGDWLSCWYDAFYNLTHHPDHAPQPGKAPHRLVAGTLRMKTNNRPIWGSITNNAADFIREPTESHCWIEDEDGRVWDCLHPQMLGYSRKINIPPDTGAIISGMTKKEIAKKHDLIYEPTSTTAAIHVYRNGFKNYLPLCPRRYDSGDPHGDGYIFFNMAPNKLAVMKDNKTNQAEFHRWRDEAMDFAGLITGDAATLSKWRDFYTQPLDRSLFTPICLFYEPGATMNDFAEIICYQLSLDDKPDTEPFIREGARSKDYKLLLAQIQISFLNKRAIMEISR